MSDEQTSPDNSGIDPSDLVNQIADRLKGDTGPTPEQRMQQLNEQFENNPAAAVMAIMNDVAQQNQAAVADQQSGAVETIKSLAMNAGRDAIGADAFVRYADEIRGEVAALSDADQMSQAAVIRVAQAVRARHVDEEIELAVKQREQQERENLAAQRFAVPIADPSGEGEEPETFELTQVEHDTALAIGVSPAAYARRLKQMQDPTLPKGEGKWSKVEMGSPEWYEKNNISKGRV